MTGGATRIGRTICLRLAAEGWAVAVHYRDSADAAAALVSEIESAGWRATMLDADLGDEVARVGGDETEDAPAERQRVRVVIEPRSQADGDDG